MHLSSTSQPLPKPNWVPKHQRVCFLYAGLRQESTGSVLNYVCDIDNVKSWLEGKSTFQVLASMTVVQTGDDKFPLREAVRTQLEKLESLPVLRLEDDVSCIGGRIRD